MANPTRPSYRPNLNRNPTKKWAEAQSVDYGGDDWGDDDYDDDYEQSQHDSVSAGSQRYPTWGQPSGHSAQRSFTNPALTVNTGRTSFDRDDDRRHFSAGGYNSRSQAQPHASQFLQQDASVPQHRGQMNPPLQVDTRTSTAPTHITAQSGLRGTQNDPYGVPHSAPASHLPQYLQSGTSFDQQGALGRDFLRENPDRGLAASATKPHTDRSDPTRAQPSLEPIAPVGLDESFQPHETSQSLDTKPLPFIRPADIYKRMEEEREKERRSQESSRPSIDSTTGRVTSSPVRSTEPVEYHASPAEVDIPVVAKPMLDTMQERKTGHNLSPISERSIRSPVGLSTLETPTTSATAEAHRPQFPSRTASSVYTDHQDPTSASSTGPAIIHHEQESVRLPANIASRQPAQYSPAISVPSGIVATTEQPRQASEDLPDFDRGVSLTPTSASVDRTPGLTENLGHRNEHVPAVSRNHEYQPLPTAESEGHSAFNPENALNLSPITSHDTFPRSNSNSTPDISPVTSRATGISHERDIVTGARPQAASVDSQGQLPKFDQAGSSVAPNFSRDTAHGTTLPATTFVPEGHQEPISPSTQKGRAQRPLDLASPVVSDLRIKTIPPPPPPPPPPVTSVAPRDSTMRATPFAQETHTTRERSPHKQSISQTELVPPPTSRTASEDWHDWQAQRKQFNAKHGIQDSDTASPALSSPISRAESPAKGTVRDIAERLESNSGRSSPVNQGFSDSRGPILDKPLNSRNESFRPALPGGWVSYSNIPSQSESSEAPAKIQPQHPPLVNDNSRTESTDSIPTAKAPKQWQSSNTGTMEAAFAAAAAAGSAMMGAFSGPALARNKRSDSETSSEDEDYSVADQSRPPESSETRDFASSPLHRHDQSHNTNTLPTIVSPPGRTDVSRDINTAGPHHPIDIPAPLRTSRSDESNKTSPRISVPSIASLQHTQDHEQLEDEIVQSLTPKTSRMDDSQLRAATTFNRPHESTNRSSQQVSSISDEDELYHPDRRSLQDGRPLSLSDKNSMLNSNAETPTKVTPRPPIPVVNIPDTIDAPEHTSAKSRPFLEQRYSWEAGPDDHEKAPETTGLNFAKGLSQERSATPPLQSLLPRPSTLSPPVPIVQKIEEEQGQPTRNADALVTTPTTSPSATTAQPNVAVVKPMSAASFPQEQTPFNDIVSYKDSTQRIRAFEENRNAYAQPNGLLEQWLTSMNIPEHRDVFDGSRVPRPQPQAGVSNIRPSPRRDTTSVSGTKLMQEDGKRLLAAAGKYSGKAGNVAKGFFAKGKDRLRTASSSDKVPTTNRRRSSSYRRSDSFDIDPPFVPRSQESVLPDKAPQLPAPALDTPTRESWSMLSSMFQERPPQANTGAGIRNAELTPGNAELSSATQGASDPNRSSKLMQSGSHKNRSSVANPPVSAVAAIPGSDTSVTRPPPAFPNYDAGVKDEVGGPTRGPSGINNSTFPQDTKKLSNAVPVDGRAPHHQRVDSLPVPRERRPSSISDVSDISATPEETKDVPHRSVSPALDGQQRTQAIPAVHTAHLSKHDEAMQNRTSMEDAALPAYDSAANNTVDKRHSKIAPGTHIVPVTDLKTTEPEEIQQAGSRPFSFFGSETLNHALSQQARLDSQRELAQQSPTEDNIRVDMEKGPQPNITEHPAYRSTDEAGEEPQLENPLPSSRRAPQEFEQYRQRQQLITVPQVPQVPQSLQKGQAEDGYRIPGPYVQEYRSPRPSKPIAGQYTSHDSHGSSGHSSSGAPAVANRLSGVPARNDASNHASQYDQRPDFDRSRSRTFGGLFRTRSKSQSRRQARDTGYNTTQGPDIPSDESKRRRGLFGLGNRSSSPADRVNDWQGQSSSAPDSGRGRKMSMDMLRPANVNKPQTDTKKKRSSGFGSLFGITSSRDRDDYRNDNYERENYRNDDYRRDGYRPEPRASPPFPSSSQQNYRDYNRPPPTNQQPVSVIEQRYGPLNTNPTAHPQYTDSPTTLTQNQYGTPGTAYQETNAYYGPGGPPLQSGQANVDSRQTTSSRPQIYEGLPKDTITAVSRAPEPYQAAVNAAAPAVSGSPSIPVTRSNRDISHTQERAYASPTSESRPDMADHVKNLHKRSRSPRLGRPPSDEHLHGSVVDQNNSNLVGQRGPQNPAAQLGMFHNKKISPGGGVPRSEEEQEKPWIIGLPNGGEDENSGRDFHQRHQGHTHGTHGTTGNLTESSIVSPSTPYQRAYSDNIGDTVSPVTAVEPRGHNLNALAAGNTRNNVPSTTTHQPLHRGHAGITEQRQPIAPAVVEQIPVPPSLSSAIQIPDPQPHIHHPPVPETTAKSQILDPKPQLHNTNAAQTAIAGPDIESEQPARNDTPQAAVTDRNISTNASPVVPPSQASRTLKRISIERAPENYQTASPTSTRPLTVAEKLMGIQPTARGTVPEHRSTTPIPHSPAPSLGAPPKTTTWPDNMPSTTAISTTNTTPTTVTTTTMRSGSKLNKGSTKTRTYVIDSNTPSRSNSNAVANSSKKIIDPDQSTVRSNTSVSAPLEGTSLTPATTAQTANTTAGPATTDVLPTSTGSKRIANKGTAPAHGKSFEAFELPGSRPDGYESEEEIVMSATAYPGQEWMPEYAQGVTWDD